ncbi:Gfo/Idh/MocA family protein [Kibdelosporangium persicum]|uniref:Glucose--fructose oxidoreductase n=1 Tax=Kibdelosporangium persicum TaxID=2698649 RepID=A0ABX2F5Y4_9PSEU|nr:Gfo/Idh/MocA family oxidoreductase [Kibdelosporangium persicum]NRN66569.1 Glucose--fructose oxidoreductase [Kibdelosporangium persicum]
MTTVTNPVRFGVLGCADVAWRRTLPAFAESATATVTAVASRDKDKARRFADRFECETVLGYDALLDRSDIEAVYIPLPTGLHHEWCAKALRAGKHVLAEKPLATTHQQAAELAGLARETGLCLMENRMFVQHTQHDAVRKLVANGELGELRVFNSTMAFPPLSAQDVRYRPDLGGGALLDAGFYPLHAAMLFLAEPLEVLGANLRRDPVSGVDVRGSVLLRAGDGVTAHLTFGFEHSYRSHYELWGSRGRLTLERAFTPPPDFQPVIRVERQDGTEQITLPPSHQYRDTIDAFTTAVRDGVPLDAHLETAVRGAALMDAVRTVNQPLE